MPVATATDARPKRVAKTRSAAQLPSSAALADFVTHDIADTTLMEVRRQRLLNMNIAEPALSILQQLAWEVTDARY